METVVASFLLFYQQSTSLFSLSVFYWLSTNFYCPKLKLSVRFRRARLDSRSTHSQRFTRVQSDCFDPARERDKLHLSVSLSSSLSLSLSFTHTCTHAQKEIERERERERGGGNLHLPCSVTDPSSSGSGKTRIISQFHFCPLRE